MIIRKTATRVMYSVIDIYRIVRLITTEGLKQIFNDLKCLKFRKSNC